MKNMIIYAKKNLSLWGILFLALAIRLYKLGEFSLWTDEAFSYYTGLIGIPQLLESLRVGDFSPPGYYLFLHFWTQLGNSEFILRLPSVAASLGCIAVAYFLFERIVNKRVATFTALLMTISSWFLTFSHFSINLVAPDKNSDTLDSFTLSFFATS